MPPIAFGAVVALLSFLTSMYAQVQQKKAAEELNEAQLKQNLLVREAAKKQFESEAFALRRQEQQQQEQIAEQAESVTRQALALRGVALASSGTAGVGGTAVTDVLDDIKRQEVGTLSRLNRFQKLRSSSIQGGVRAARQNYVNRVLGSQPGPTVIPTIGAGAVLGAVGTGLSTGAAAEGLFGLNSDPASITPQTNSTIPGLDLPD